MSDETEMQSVADEQDDVEESQPSAISQLPEAAAAGDAIVVAAVAAVIAGAVFLFRRRKKKADA